MAASRGKKLKPSPIGGKASAPASREIELKLLLDPATLVRIRRAGALSRLPGIKPHGRATTRNLTTVYWDTKDNKLAKVGLALRLRRDGVRVIQALKAADGSPGLAADRAEDESQIPPDKAQTPPDIGLVRDPALRARAEAAIDGKRLVPVFETAVSRVARLYGDADGGMFEAALDLGEVRVAGAAEPVCEIELEHRKGPVAGLFAVARAVASSYPVRVGTESKAARGYALAAAGREGVPKPEPAAVLAGKSPVLPGMTTRQACGALLTHGVRQMAANQEAVLAGPGAPVSADGVHQMRVAMRRFRAVHSAFRRAVPLPDADLVIPQIKSVFQVLGAARDLDVFCTETLPELMQATTRNAPPLEPLAAAAREARLEAWRSVIAAVSGRSFTRLLLDAGYLAACTQMDTGEVGPGEVSARTGHTRRARAGLPKNELATFAAARLDHRMKQVERQARHLAELDDEARHDLRKRLKALRYEAAFFAPLWPPDDAKAFLRPLKAMQDHFGAINDAATAARMARLAADRIGGETANRAAGFVGGWYAARADMAYAQVQENWAGFGSLRGFWCLPPRGAA